MIDWMVLFTGVIAFATSLAVLGGFIWFIIKISLRLIEKDIRSIKKDLSNHITELKAGQDKLEKDFKEDIAELKAGQKELKADFKEDIAELKAGQKELKADFKEDIAELKEDFKAGQSRLESKIDQILSR